MAGLNGKRVGVFGLGKSGLSAAALLLREGARVVLIDEKAEAAQSPAVKALVGRGASLALGAQLGNLGQWERSPDRDGLDLLVVSPGVPLALPVLQQARARGLEIIGEVELAFRHLPTRPLVGITGTNGKSTTTALTGEMFQQAGRRTFVGGNLGLPLAEAALAPEPYDAYVVELSSFQLEGIAAFRPNVAAILNLTPDHIDRYPSHQAYGAAKARIFGNQQPGDFAVVNADDADVVRLAGAAKVPVFGFTIDPTQVGRGQKPAPTSGLGSGLFAGLAIAEGHGFRFDFAPHRFDIKSRALRGAHNLQNAMAAALLAFHAGIPADAIQRALESFPGLPHRIESVRVLDGVEWINDSKATNVDSSLVALKAFPQKNVWLIAGGKGKGAPYEPLVEAGRNVLKGVLTIGKDAPTIEAAFEKVTPVHTCATIDVAVRRARELAVSGDVVLLSPACASYDQFKNFEDRGDTFKRLVRELRS